MSDKVFDLLEKIYIELPSTKEIVSENSKAINENSQNTNQNSENTSKLRIIVENDVSKKINVLFESHEIIISRLERIENKIDLISDKVDRHDVRIQVIEGGNK